MRMGRQHPPEADASSGRGGQGEPAGSTAQEVRSPGAAQLRRPERKERSPRPGAAARGTHMAGGRRPPSLPAPGRTHNLLSLPGGASTVRETVLPSSPRSLTAAEPPGPTREGEQGPAAGGELREDARRRRPCSPAPRGSPAAARAERCGRAPGSVARGRRSGSAFGRRGTQRLLPSAARPSSLSCPLPSRPPGPGADAARARRGKAGTLPARGAGRGGARGRRAPGSPPTPRAAVWAPPAPRPLPPSWPRDSFQRESGGGRETEK